MDLPTELTVPDFSILEKNLTIPSNLDTSAVSYVGEFSSPPLAFFISNTCTAAKLPNNGEGVRLHSITPKVAGDQGWTTVETAFIQLDTGYTPFGRFPGYWDRPVPNQADVKVGYDAAVCVQRYEPWIVEAYNSSTGSSFALRIVGKGDGSTSLSPGGNLQGAPITNTGYLNSTGKGFVFSSVHNHSVSRFWESNTDQGHYYTGQCLPTPIVGPVLPPRTTLLLTDPPHRLFPSLTVLELRDTPNSLQTDSPLPVHGTMRLMFCRTWWGQDP